MRGGSLKISSPSEKPEGPARTIQPRSEVSSTAHAGASSTPLGKQPKLQSPTLGACVGSPLRARARRITTAAAEAKTPAARWASLPEFNVTL
eukprot:CAMPEP_0170584168 /NCGR_PEP_ID=MMETSP0224-20130122/8544_1 /TAXON_ID=285029 /ORGANISM="Togula jolla, Strain CCCM 725" /LENGTH=91 /DNA_ID=CAMNT_0010907583 /DNA_START=1185 /DNA_END=1460 /DNA_ORIENTATION=+